VGVPQGSFLGSVFDPHFGEDNFGATVGYKAWVNTWDLPIFFSQEDFVFDYETEQWTQEKKEFPERQDMITTMRSEREVTHIPVVSFRYKNFFVSGSYFPKTDYDFGTHKIDFEFFPNDWWIVTGGWVVYDPDYLESDLRVKVPVEYSVTAERSEWDITAGYYLSRNVAITVGYKKIKREYSQSLEVPSVSHGDFEDEDFIIKEWEAYSYQSESVSEGDGLTLGIATSASIGGGFGVYGNFAYGWLESEDSVQESSYTIEGEEKESLVSRPSISFDNNYLVGEMGLAYSFRFKNPTINAASIYAGYRFQRYEFEDVIASGQTARDSTDGFVLGVNIVF
jgi:hypothetical protein